MSLKGDTYIYSNFSIWQEILESMVQAAIKRDIAILLYAIISVHWMHRKSSAILPQ